MALIAMLLAIHPATSTEVRADPPITAVAFAPGGQQILLGSQAGIHVRAWPDVDTTHSTIPTQLDHIHDLAFAPDGQHLLVAGGSPSEAGTVEVFSWPEASLVQRIAEHDDLVYRVAWAPSGNEWASAGADGICQVFSTTTGEVISRYAGHSRTVLALCYLPDGKTIASAGVDQTIHLWDSRSAEHLRTLDNHLAAINDLAARPSPTAAAAEHRSTPSLPTIASVSADRTVRFWQPTIGRLVRFARLPAIGQTLAWTPAGDFVLVGCVDGRVRVIDPETAAITDELLVSEGEPIYALTVEPGGSRMLVGAVDQARRLTWQP